MNVGPDGQETTNYQTTTAKNKQKIHTSKTAKKTKKNNNNQNNSETKKEILEEKTKVKKEKWQIDTAYLPRHPYIYLWPHTYMHL